MDLDPDEVASLAWIEVAAMPWDRIAFESTRRALRRYARLRATGA